MYDVINWNRDLYVYHHLRGGRYLGSWNADWPAQLELEREGCAMVLRAEAIYHRYGARIRVRLLSEVELGGLYTLTISEHSALNRGLTLLQKEDYGCPELSRDRRFQTNNPEFTTRALRDSRWRQSLLACPRAALEVRPTAGGQSGAHTISLSAWMDDLVGVGEPEYYYEATAGDLLRQLDQGTMPFRRSDLADNLDRITDLGAHTVGALRAWRM